MWATSLCAAPQVIEGFALKEPLSIDLDFSSDEYLLVKASQSHADYFLELIERDTNKVIRTVDFSADTALDDAMLVASKDCSQCIVTIRPTELIDANSPYKISVEPILSSDINQVKALNLLTTAGEYKQKSNHSGGDFRTKLLRLCATELTKLIKLNSHQWRHHGLLRLAETQGYLDDTESYQKTLEQLDKETISQQSSNRAYALIQLSSYEKDNLKSYQLIEEAIQIGEAIEDKRVYAFSINYKALRLTREAKFSEALNLLDTAYIIFSETYRWRDSLTVLHNLSWASQVAGKLPESLAYATQQQLLAETYNHQDSTVLALYNFAMAYDQIGERFISDEFLDKAIEQHAQLPNTSSLGVLTGAALLLQKTEGLITYGAFESALDYAIKSKQEFTKLGFPGRSADIYDLEAQIAFAMKDYELAEQNYKNVIQYDQENNRPILKSIRLLRLTELKIAQAKYVESSNYISEALKVLSSSEDYTHLGTAFGLAAELLYHMGAHQDAQDLLDRTSKFIEMYAVEENKAQLAYRKALIANSIGNTSLAIESLALARAIIEDTLPKIRQRDLRRTYLALQKSIFELNIKVLLSTDPDNLLAPLALAETYKARTLAENINSVQSDHKNINNELSLQRKVILDNIQKNAALWHATNHLEVSHDSLLRETRELSQSLEKLEVQIANIQGEPQKLLKPITVDQIPMPQKNELIAYYFVGNNNSWLWVITNQTTVVYDLPKEQELTTLANNYLSQVNVAPTSRVNSTAWQQASAINTLSEVLLSPLKKYLQNSAIELITIIPDGPLHGLSFAPLKALETTSPIIKDYALSYAPSLIINQSLNLRFRSSLSKNNIDLLVVADPINQSTSNINFADLPFSKQEALTIKSLADDNATLLLSENATKAKLLDELSKPYSVLHFATHGLLNKHEPSLSGLVLSASDSGDNHLWLSPEISNTQITADLVILSACDSSIGKSISGEGLFSLSRAFIEAGANQVIGTLWRVQDQSTSALFENFYSQIFDQNLGVAKALQQAQLAIYSDENNDWSDPYYWAGFQLLGGGANQSYATRQ